MDTHLCEKMYYVVYRKFGEEFAKSEFKDGSKKIRRALA